LDQIEKNKTQELVPRPTNNFIGTKWVVCKGSTQIEGMDFDESFSLIVRLEAVRMFLEISYFRKFKI